MKIKSIIKNYKNIFEGWSNLAKNEFGMLSEEDKAIVNERSEKCNSCIFHSENAKRELGYVSSIPYKHCSSCLCPIPAKVMALNDDCGLKEFSFNPYEDSKKHILQYYENNNEEIQWRWFAKDSPFLEINFNQK